MAVVLDTSVAIHLRDGDVEITRRVFALKEDLFLAMATRIELESGVFADTLQTAVRLPRLRALLESVPVLQFDDPAADAYRAILASTGYSRRKILDRMIAAQALVHGATLVTLNPADFSDIPNLKLLAW
ncbi:MAG: PIN domain-containing protein [Caulobacter sp.]|nr:PIN domain-containing protein [Caulobacter sp.]